MFTLVTVILFCAVLIGYQIPKQQVKMKQNQIEDLQEEQRILRDKNGELNKLVKRQLYGLYQRGVINVCFYRLNGLSIY